MNMHATAALPQPDDLCRPRSECDADVPSPAAPQTLAGEKWWPRPPLPAAAAASCACPPRSGFTVSTLLGRPAQRSSPTKPPAAAAEPRPPARAPLKPAEGPRGSDEEARGTDRGRQPATPTRTAAADHAPPAPLPLPVPGHDPPEYPCRYESRAHPHARRGAGGEGSCHWQWREADTASSTACCRAVPSAASDIGRRASTASDPAPGRSGARSGGRRATVALADAGSPARWKRKAAHGTELNGASADASTAPGPCAGGMSHEL